MTAGYYTSLNSEKVRKLVMYAPAYAFALHTNLGAGSGLQNKRKPYEFNYALGVYRTASTAQNTTRWDGEIPVADKSTYRDPALPAPFWNACFATDPTSNSRNPPALRAPNGVLEDTFMQERDGRSGTRRRSIRRYSSSRASMTPGHIPRIARVLCGT